MSDNRDGVGTYLTEAEAKEFHKLFVSSFMAFTALAIVAHILVYMKTPWGLM
jgi:light-harvesting complex 1 beta chain